MENKRTAEYYIHEDKDNGNIKLFMLVNGKMKIKGNKKKDINESLRYALSTAQYMDTVNLYSNIPLTSDAKQQIINTPNVFYKKAYKEYPLPFKDFLTQYDKDKNSDNKAYLSMNTFSYEGYNFLATTIKINEFKRTLIKILRYDLEEESVILNHIKDIIPSHIDYVNKEFPIVFRNRNKDCFNIFERNPLREDLMERIEKVEIVPFDVKEFISNNIERIDSLIMNNKNHERIKEEVKAKYEDEKDKNKLVIYTDASTFLDKKNNINDSGCGIVIKQDISDDIMFEVNRKFKPSKKIFDPNVSEGNAILEALNFIKDAEIIDNKTLIEIRSDSISNIRKLNDLENHYKISKAIVIFCKEHLKDIDVEFKWVKGHSTYKYNVMADDLASSSLFNSDFDLKIKENTQAVEDFKKRNLSSLKMKR